MSDERRGNGGGWEAQGVIRARPVGAGTGWLVVVVVVVVEVVAVVVVGRPASRGNAGTV